MIYTIRIVHWPSFELYVMEAPANDSEENPPLDSPAPILLHEEIQKVYHRLIAPRTSRIIKTAADIFPS